MLVPCESRSGEALRSRKLLIVTASTVLALSMLTSVLLVAGKGSPWDRVWAAIDTLMGRVDELEQQPANIKYLRFVEDTEYLINFEINDKIKVASFTVSPESDDNNAVLDYNYYFEYKASIPSSTTLQFQIYIHDASGVIGDGSSYLGAMSIHMVSSIPDYRWTQVGRLNINIGQLPVPNQLSYTVEVYAYRDGPGTVWMRNFNIIIELMDGLPPIT